MDNRSFAQLLRQHRLALSLTQEELAERAGLSARAISDLERGLKHAPRASTVRLLMRGLDLREAEAAALLRAAQPRQDHVPDARREHDGHGLPAQLTSFVGREHELAEVRALLGRTRLLTLTGPGGVGKTRLALAAAAGLVDDYPDGLWVADLAPLADPVLVARTVAVAGGVPEEPGVPAEAVLARALGERRILLVLDNCEHLALACARLADALLRACSGLRILATSREVLGTAGEVTWPVPVLSLPPEDIAPRITTASALASSEAVRLFAERAASARPGFELADANAAAIARLCRRLDGLPLALELAAARVRALTPEQIAARLDDRFHVLTGGERGALPRHQTLAGTVAWSYDLLGEAERVMFQRLAVFAGGWTLEAAESVCAGPAWDDSQLAPQQVLDTLARLVDRSLVLAIHTGGAVRYRYLETIREYAYERLREELGAEPATRHAHACYFLTVAEQAEDSLYEAEAPRLLAVLAAERDNTRAALRWTLDSGETELALRLAASLYRFWRQRGYVLEGRGWLAAALQQAKQSDGGGPAVMLARARALNAAGVLARDAGDYGDAKLLQSESVELFDALGDKERLANAEQNLGQVLFRLGETAAARVLLERNLARLQRFDRGAIARSAALFPCMATLGQLAVLRGDYTAALDITERAVLHARSVGSPHIVAQALTYLGVLRVEIGDYSAAIAALHEALPLAAGVRDTWSTFQALHALASAAAALGQGYCTAVLLAASESLGGRSGIRTTVTHPIVEIRLKEALAGLNPAVLAEARAQGTVMTLDAAVAYSLSDVQYSGRGEMASSAAGA